MLLDVLPFALRLVLLLLQENLRQLCVFKLANESGVPWKWWEYVTRFGDECKMSENQYNEECAERVSPALIPSCARLPKETCSLEDSIRDCKMHVRDTECLNCDGRSSMSCKATPGPAWPSYAAASAMWTETLTTH